MTLPTPTELSNLQTLFQNYVVRNLGGVTAGNAVSAFLNDLTIFKWTDMDVAIQSFIQNYSGVYNGLRVQISKSNGSPAYDSESGGNSYSAAINNNIGNNINTLVSVTNAIQNGSGYEYQNEYSAQYGTYTNALTSLRVGATSQNFLGCCVLSYDVISYY